MFCLVWYVRKRGINKKMNHGIERHNVVYLGGDITILDVSLHPRCIS